MRMRKIISILIVIFYLFGIAFAQDAINESETSKSRDLIKKRVSNTVIEEDAWKVFFPKFKKSIGKQDVTFLKGVLSKDFDCFGFGNCMQNNNSNKKNIEIFLKENARDEDKDGKSGDGWMFLEKVLKEGSVSNDFSGLKSINNSYEMVIRFEFRNKKWLFIQCSVAEGA